MTFELRVSMISDPEAGVDDGELVESSDCSSSITVSPSHPPLPPLPDIKLVFCLIAFSSDSRIEVHATVKTMFDCNVVLQPRIKATLRRDQPHILFLPLSCRYNYMY